MKHLFALLSILLFAIAALADEPAIPINDQRPPIVYQYTFQDNDLDPGAAELTGGDLACAVVAAAGTNESEHRCAANRTRWIRTIPDGWTFVPQEVFIVPLATQGSVYNCSLYFLYDNDMSNVLGDCDGDTTGDLGCDSTTLVAVPLTQLGADDCGGNCDPPQVTEKQAVTLPDIAVTGWYTFAASERFECAGGTNVGDICVDDGDCPSSTCDSQSSSLDCDDIFIQIDLAGKWREQ